VLAVAIALLCDLGFTINMKPEKTVAPARTQKFVGTVLNSARLTLSLPRDKLADTLSAVSEVLSHRSAD
jgi:hypothetical protein